jgi:hypothetical protein
MLHHAIFISVVVIITGIYLGQGCHHFASCHTDIMLPAIMLHMKQKAFSSQIILIYNQANKHVLFVWRGSLFQILEGSLG